MCYWNCELFISEVFNKKEIMIIEAVLKINEAGSVKKLNELLSELLRKE